jgi:hypothetical protein
MHIKLRLLVFHNSKAVFMFHSRKTQLINMGQRGGRILGGSEISKEEILFESDYHDDEA